MKVELLAISEGAYNHNGRLTLVEAFDVMHVQQVPIEAAVGLAAKILFCPEDTGHHAMTIRVSQPGQQNPIADFNSEIDVPNDPEGGKLLMAANVRGFKIPFDGIYNLMLLIDGNEIYTTTFKVVCHEND